MTKRRKRDTRRRTARSASPPETEAQPKATPDPSRRTFGLPWLLLIVLVSLAALRWHNGQVQFDDAYISYRYAENLASGQGLTFNPPERVEGYTNFLWVLALATGAKVGIPPEHLAPALGVASYLLSICLAWHFVWFITPEQKPAARAIATGLLLALIIAPGFAATSGNGMESHFFSLLALALGILGCYGDLGRMQASWFSVLALALVLTRPDGAIFVAVGFLALGLRLYVADAPRALKRQYFLLTVLPTATGLLAYAAWKAHYFGSVLPNSYYAKGGGAPHYDAGIAYLRTFLGSYPHVLLALPLVLLSLRRPSPSNHRSFAWYALLGAVGYAMLLARVGGDFMEYRLALHFYPLLLVAALPGFLWVLQALPRVASAWLGLLLVASMMPTGHEMKFYMQTLEEMDGYVDLGARVGQSLAALPDDTKVATTLIGTLGYYSDLHIVDQWGLIDPTTARDGEARDPFVRGHLKPTSLQHIYEQGANLYFEHPHVCSCSQPCVEDLPNVFIRLEGDYCVRSWYIRPEPRLTEFLCSDPQRYILHNVSCDGPADSRVATTSTSSSELPAPFRRRTSEALLVGLHRRPSRQIAELEVVRKDSLGHEHNVVETKRVGTGAAARDVGDFELEGKQAVWRFETVDAEIDRARVHRQRRQ